MEMAKGKSREEVKAELLELAEKRIEEALGIGDKGKRATLSEIEAKVLEIQDELSVKLAEAMVGEQEKGQLVPGPGCGKEMRYKESHGINVTSWVGEIRVERGSYHCAEWTSGALA